MFLFCFVCLFSFFFFLPFVSLCSSSSFPLSSTSYFSLYFFPVFFFSLLSFLFCVFLFFSLIVSPSFLFLYSFFFIFYPLFFLNYEKRFVPYNFVISTHHAVIIPVIITGATDMIVIVISYFLITYSYSLQGVIVLFILITF